VSFTSEFNSGGGRFGGGGTPVMPERVPASPSSVFGTEIYYYHLLYNKKYNKKKNKKKKYNKK
jgi:hypothetical protein